MGWLQAAIAFIGAGILTGLANLWGQRNKSREVWSEEGVRIRDELREHIERLEEQIDKQEDRIKKLEAALALEEKKNTRQQETIEKQAHQITRLTEEVNRMRAEKGLPPIQSADDL